MQAQEQVQVEQAVRIAVRTTDRAAGWPVGSVASTAVGTAGSAAAAASAASPGSVVLRLPCRSEQPQQDQHS